MPASRPLFSWPGRQIHGVRVALVNPATLLLRNQSVRNAYKILCEYRHPPDSGIVAAEIVDRPA
jgi:hypothetical protein